MNQVPTQRLSASQMYDIIQNISKNMFGQNWTPMVKQSQDDLKQLFEIELISRRDKYIFFAALHFGIKYGVAYSHALAKAQRPWNLIKSFFTRRKRA